MSRDLDRGRRRPARSARSGAGRRGSRQPFDDDLDEDGFDELEEDDEPAAAPRRRSGAQPRGRPTPGRRPAGRRQGGSSWSLFGSKRSAPGRRRTGRGFDWEAAEEEEDDYGREDDGGWDDEDEAEEIAPRRRRAPARRSARRSRTTLMDLSTPVFGLATMLPREAGGPQPAYEQFRQEVLSTLQKIESEGPQHGIEKEDAGEARYALALFMDEQVAGSEWAGRTQWASEPLNMVLINDPSGGINFYTHLEALGDRQKGVKKVYLVCLALGFRGRYGELDPAQQAAQIGDIRQKLVRSIQNSMDSQDVLFPEAYEAAIPLEGKVPPPPGWWLVASLGMIAALLVVWLGLFWFAGRSPEPAQNKLRTLIQGSDRTAGSSLQRPSGAAAGEGAP